MGHTVVTKASILIPESSLVASWSGRRPRCFTITLLSRLSLSLGVARFIPCPHLDAYSRCYPVYR